MPKKLTYAKPYNLINMLPNPLFNNNAQGWGTHKTNYLRNVNSLLEFDFIFDGEAIILYSSGTDGFLPYTLGNKVYVSVDTNSGCLSYCGVRFYSDTYVNNQSSNITKTANVNERISLLAEYNVSNVNKIDFVFSKTHAIGLIEYKLKYPIVINLSEAFGVGNEPTKEWCDNNLDFFERSNLIWV